MFFQGSNVLIKVYTALSTTSERVAIFHLTNQQQKQKKPSLSREVSPKTLLGFSPCARFGQTPGRIFYQWSFLEKVVFFLLKSQLPPRPSKIYSELVIWCFDEIFQRPYNGLYPQKCSSLNAWSYRHTNMCSVFLTKDYAIIFVLCLLQPKHPTSLSWFWPIQGQPFELPLIVLWQLLRTWQRKTQIQYFLMASIIDIFTIGANNR